jgi:cytochrome P450
MVKIEDINLCDLEQFTSGCPEAAFKTIRQEAPVWFHPATEQAPDHEGFWVISRHADAKAALKNHQVFSSETGYGARVGGGTTLGDMSTDMAPGVVLAMMDPPKHDDIRALVGQGFFPRTLTLLEQEVRELTSAILDAVDGESEFDFLERVAAQLPLQVICTMANIPREDWHRVMEWADAAITFAAHDANVDTAPLIEKLTEMGMYAFNLIQQIRQQEPDDSVMSKVVHAEIPGTDGQPRKLDDLEIIRFFNLLMTGGTETTRNAIAYGYYMLLKNPQQYAVLESDPEKYIDDAIEEILRWTSPVHFNRRTAGQDIEFQGCPIKRGDKVTVWYPSANRDEDVFEDPYTFNIFRQKNPHLAFGHGIHHCLGAALARMELRVLFLALIERMRGKTVEPVGEISFIRSNRHQGVAEMNIRISPKTGNQA